MVRVLKNKADWKQAQSTDLDVRTNSVGSGVAKMPVFLIKERGPGERWDRETKELKSEIQDHVEQSRLCKEFGLYSFEKITLATLEN